MDMVLENGNGRSAVERNVVDLPQYYFPFQSNRFLEDKAALDSIEIRRHSDKTAERHPDLFTPEGNSPVPRDLQKKGS